MHDILTVCAWEGEVCVMFCFAADHFARVILNLPGLACLPFWLLIWQVVCFWLMSISDVCL